MKDKVIRTIKLSYYIVLFFFCMLTAYVFNFTAGQGFIAFVVIATFISSTTNNKWVIY